MRRSIPAFRLPVETLDSEIDAILRMGVDVRYGTPVTSLRALLAEGFDAVFVGSGAPRGKELYLPGRWEEAPDDPHIHIGLDWLQSIAFGHVDAIGERVLVIGVGNTAMDCCRSSLRLGANEVTVVARRPRAFFKASPWELEDAEDEGVEILVNHAPRRFVVEDGRLTGMEFDVLEWDERATVSKVVGSVVLPCTDVVVAIGQENAFPWIEQGLGVDVGDGDLPAVDATTMQSTLPGVFFGGDGAFGPKNIITAVAHAHEAAISIHAHCQGRSVTDRPAIGMNLVSQKMGMSQWSYSNDYDAVARQRMDQAELARRFERLDQEVELGFTADKTLREVQRCLNCDVQTTFEASLCIECDACIDVCPTACLTITANGDEPDLRKRLTIPAANTTQDLFVSGGLPQTGRVMVKDEDVCVHCGLCAERCPTAAWDMQRLELTLPRATGPAPVRIISATEARQ